MDLSPFESITRTDWALTGRTEELELLRSLRSGPRPTSALLSGPAGVGKSRLAREALAEADKEGWATLAIRGSAGFSAVPLGPFRTVFPSSEASGVTELTDHVVRELNEIRSPKGLLLLVDDGQDLDVTSAALIQQMAATGQLVVIVTARTGTAAPAAVTGLWKDGVARRIKLQNLSRRETSELLTAGLGGPVQDTSATQLCRITAGNPLYLREVVMSSAETGALHQIDGEWRWQGEWATGERLQEIVSTRLGRLDPDELTAMELLAVAGALPLGIVMEASSVQAVMDLETRGLVVAAENGRRLDVSIEHPLHAEVLRGRMPPLQQRAVRRNLIDALNRTGALRAEDRVRIACWSMEAGVDVDPTTLVLGANASLFRIGEAVSARLKEIVPDAAPDPTETSPVPHDREMATRLAQAAYDQTGALREGLALASVLAWTGAIEDAEIVLAQLHNKATTIDDRLRIARGLSFVRFWGHFHVDEAVDVLIEAIAEADGGADPLLLAEIYQDLAGIAFNIGNPAEALEYADKAAAMEGVDVASSVASATAAAAITYQGRFAEATAFVDIAVRVAHARGNRMAVAQLLVARSGVLARTGETEAARKLIEWLRDLALAEGVLDPTAALGVVLGEIFIRLGRPASASRIFRDSAGLLAEKDLFGYLPWALTGLARARAMCGEEASAAAALDQARRVQTVVRFYDASRYLADVELYTLTGRHGDAANTARDGAAWAKAAGLLGDEVQCLAALARLEPSAETAARLAEVAASGDSPLAEALAKQAQALVASDPDSMLDVSEQFAAMSAWWWAAVAASTATDILYRTGAIQAARAASRQAAEFAEHCEGPQPPMPQSGLKAPTLTKREREIAVLASAGHSSKEIGSKMYLSPRTVENHLHHVYVKLGVTDRTTLAAAMERPSSTE